MGCRWRRSSVCRCQQSAHSKHGKHGNAQSAEWPSKHGWACLLPTDLLSYLRSSVGQYAETSAKEAQEVEAPFKLVAAAARQQVDRAMTVPL